MTTSPMRRQRLIACMISETVARRLNVAVKTVRRMIDRGELGYHQIGRLKRVSNGQYLAYLARTRRGQDSR